MSEHKVIVEQVVVVTLDESKFTAEFMQEFRESIYPFTSIGEHAEHLAQLYARGLVSDFGDDFIEGYGPASEMGIKFAIEDQSETLVEPQP